MKIKNCKSELERFLKATPSLNISTPIGAITAFAAFHSAVKFDKAMPSMDGDLLLVEWGHYNWGQGQHFSFSVTRQLIQENGKEQDILQCRQVFRYRPIEGLMNARGSRWSPLEVPIPMLMEDASVSEIARAVQGATTFESVLSQAWQ